MSNYVDILTDKNGIDNWLPRTTLSSIADEDGNYLSSSLTASDINPLKNGRIDAEKAYMIEHYEDGYSWYRIWSDGWCEQGGRVLSNAFDFKVTLLKPYIDRNYRVLSVNDTNNTRRWSQSGVTDESTIWVRASTYSGKPSSTYCNWKASGYAQGYV